MLEKTGPHCRVALFEKYLQHLNPENEFLFQRSKRSVSPYDQLWYDNMVIGERSLGSKMENISQEAGLSVTIFDNSGFEARHIMAVSDNRNEASIRSYRKTDIITNRKMSETECELRSMKHRM